jgi:hypothetical protein
MPRKIQVLTQLRNEWLYKKLINTDKKSLGSANVDLRLFNPFTNAARMLIKRLRLPPSPEYDAGTFVVIGFGAYGREATLHLIRAALVGLNSTLNILVIDQKADLLKEKFLVAILPPRSWLLSTLSQRPLCPARPISRTSLKKSCAPRVLYSELRSRLERMK